MNIEIYGSQALLVQKACAEARERFPERLFGMTDSEVCNELVKVALARTAGRDGV